MKKKNRKSASKQETQTQGSHGCNYPSTRLPQWLFRGFTAWATDTESKIDSYASHENWHFWELVPLGPYDIRKAKPGTRRQGELDSTDDICKLGDLRTCIAKRPRALEASKPMWTPEKGKTIPQKFEVSTANSDLQRCCYHFTSIFKCAQNFYLL